MPKKNDDKKGSIGDRVPTGIQGFDSVISGGLVRNSVNLLSGGPGTGKTIFALQYLINGSRIYGQKGLYISIEESESELKSDLESLGIDLKGLENKLKIAYLPIYEVADFIKFIADQISGFKPERVVIDPVTALSMSMEDDLEKRKVLYELKELLKKSNCTSLLICESGSSSIDSESQSTSQSGVEEFICDGVIMLHHAGIGGDADRAIRVVKMRRTKHVRGPIQIEIEKLGIKVSRRSI
ncbi:AAA family ATPase [Candidatus Woesearchaeota archaeon]|nr:AAA family ATPase [Candidatus Woesearchaeota archaeon]